MTRRTVHLYPFPPWGWYGGSLRLRTAIQGSAQDSEPVVYWWNSAAASWTGPLPITAIGSADSAGVEEQGGLGRAKRWVFPSTLLESGRRAARAVGSVLDTEDVTEADRVVLHTSYLSGAISTVRGRSGEVFVDVHDLVWRAQRMDADNGGAATWLPRACYTGWVRSRETRLLGQASGLLVCGWRDAELLAATNRVAWTPVGMDRPRVDSPSSQLPLRVGFLGNFRHSATMDAGRRLADSQLARSPDIELVLGGLGSDEQRYALGPGPTLLGPVAAIEDFYRRVDVVVAPVANGSGMKCKLAESALAGRLVVTTPAGASGYPPDLRRRFIVTPEPAALSPADLVAAQRLQEPQRTRDAFAETTLEQAARRYGDALAGAWGLERPTPNQSADLARA